MTPEQLWLEIQVRRVAGEAAESPFRGVVEVRDDDTDEQVRYVVQKDRHRWRVETEDGELCSLQDHHHVYRFGGEVPSRSDRGGEPGRLASRTVARPSVFDVTEATFTDPAGPPARITFLGRDAWQVALKGPEYKDFLLVETYDAVTGMLLEERTDRGVVNVRWLEIEPVGGFDDDTFAFRGELFEATVIELTGQSLAPGGRREESSEESARDDRARDALGAVPFTTSVRLAVGHLHAEESGFVNGYLDAEVGVSFVREETRDLDDPADLVWEDDEGRAWSLSGHGSSDPALLEDVKAWLTERAPLLDEI